MTNNNFAKIEQILTQMEKIEPRTDLFFDIMSAIQKKKIMIFRFKLSGLLFLMSALTGYGVLAWKSIIIELQQSEAARLLSILFSDFSSVLANWKYYGLYFIETLPVMPILCILFGIFLVLNLVKIMVQKSPARTQLRLAHH